MAWLLGALGSVGGALGTAATGLGSAASTAGGALASGAGAVGEALGTAGSAIGEGLGQIGSALGGSDLGGVGAVQGPAQAGNPSAGAFQLIRTSNPGTNPVSRLGGQLARDPIGSLTNPKGTGIHFGLDLLDTASGGNLSKGTSNLLGLEGLSKENFRLSDLSTTEGLEALGLDRGKAQTLGDLLMKRRDEKLQQQPVQPIVLSQARPQVRGLIRPTTRRMVG